MPKKRAPGDGPDERPGPRGSRIGSRSLARDHSRSTVSSLAGQLKESLAFNEIDPTAQQNVNNYERELTEAVAELSRARSEGRMESTVDPKEVQEILRIFR